MEEGSFFEPYNIKFDKPGAEFFKTCIRFSFPGWRRRTKNSERRHHLQLDRNAEVYRPGATRCRRIFAVTISIKGVDYCAYSLRTFIFEAPGIYD